MTNRNDRPHPHLWQAESRDPVPRWRVQCKSSASGSESHLVLRIFARIFTLSILLANIPVLLPVFYWFLFAPQGTGELNSVDFWSAGSIHFLRTSRLTSCTLDFAMWSRSIPLQESRHRMLSSLQSRVVLLETNWSSMVSLKITCLVSCRLSNIPPSTHL